MTNGRTVLLALGATRRQAAVGDSARVITDGGAVTVVIDHVAAWARETFDSKVRVVELGPLECSRMSIVIEQLILFRAPRLLFRLVGRGPLTHRVRRVRQTYERRVAGRAHRRFLPLCRWLFGDIRHQLVRGRILAGVDVDLLVVSDPASLPVAAKLLASYTDSGSSPPRVCYQVSRPIPAGRPGRAG